mgnify:CR=1 FL=1
MKKVSKAVLSAALLATLAGCSSKSEDTSLKDVQSAGELKIGLEGDWQPFSYHDEDDNLVGYDVEVATKVAGKLGVKAVITEGPWDGLLTGLDTGVYGVDVTPERSETFDFTDAYAYDHIDLVVKKDNTTITSFEDLKGKKSANSTGSTYAEMGEEYGATVSNVPTLAETMELVLNGTVDATINADTSIQDYLNTTGEKGLKVVAQDDEATEYAIPVKKGNTSLKEAINDALKELREEGTLKELSIKYFGADLTEK